MIKTTNHKTGCPLEMLAKPHSDLEQHSAPNYTLSKPDRAEEQQFVSYGNIVCCLSKHTYQGGQKWPLPMLLPLIEKRAFISHVI